jgi:hypothetical protein
MWLLRHKAPIPKTEPEVLPPATAPTRRIEITVERRSITRLSRSNGAEPAQTAEPQLEQPAPPDG